MRILGLLALLSGLALVFGRTYLETQTGLDLGGMSTVGFALIGIGLVFYLIGGRRRRKALSTPAPNASRTSSIGYKQSEAPAEEKPAKPAIAWGREGDKD